MTRIGNTNQPAQPAGPARTGNGGSGLEGLGLRAITGPNQSRVYLSSSVPDIDIRGIDNASGPSATDVRSSELPSVANGRRPPASTLTPSRVSGAAGAGERNAQAIESAPQTPARPPGLFSAPSVRIPQHQQALNDFGSQVKSVSTLISKIETGSAGESEVSSVLDKLDQLRGGIQTLPSDVRSLYQEQVNKLAERFENSLEGLGSSSDVSRSQPTHGRLEDGIKDLDQLVSKIEIGEASDLEIDTVVSKFSQLNETIQTLPKADQSPFQQRVDDLATRAQSNGLL